MYFDIFYYLDFDLLKFLEIPIALVMYFGNFYYLKDLFKDSIVLI